MGMIIIFIITIILYNYYYSTPTFTKPSQSNCTHPLRICHKLSFSAKFPHIPVYEGARPFRQKGWVPRKCSWIDKQTHYEQAHEGLNECWHLQFFFVWQNLILWTINSGDMVLDLFKTTFFDMFFRIMRIQIKGEIVASVAPADRRMFFLTP